MHENLRFKLRNLLSVSCVSVSFCKACLLLWLEALCVAFCKFVKTMKRAVCTVIFFFQRQ